MNEGEIRQAAMMYGLVAEMNALLAGMEAMKAENSLREVQGFSPAYGFREFENMRKNLEGIAHCLQTKI
jgi:hypothetical protein